MRHLILSISSLSLSYFTQTLEDLNLYGNKIGATGMQYLSDALRNNKVTYLSSTLLISLLYFTQTLTTLNLAQNQIEDTGVQHLADALKNNNVIHLLCPSISSLFSSFALISYRHSLHSTLTKIKSGLLGYDILRMLYGITKYDICFLRPSHISLSHFA